MSMEFFIRLFKAFPYEYRVFILSSFFFFAITVKSVKLFSCFGFAFRVFPVELLMNAQFT